MSDARLRHAFPTLVAALTALALLAGPLAGSATGHGAAYTIELTAWETGCTGDANYCFEVTEGSLDEIEKGKEVQVRLVNPTENSLDHNVNLGPLSAASDDRSTDESEAVAATATISPGEETTAEMTVTQSYDGVYFWCSQGAHESQGMYVEHAFDGADTDDGGDVETGGEAKNSPTPGALGALAALAGIALVLRRAR